MFKRLALPFAVAVSGALIAADRPHHTLSGKVVAIAEVTR